MENDFPFSNSSTWIESASFDWKPYLLYGTEVHIRKDEYVFYEGNPVTIVCAVLSGRIRLCQLSLTGEEKAIVVVGSNAMIGEVSAMQSSGYATSAVAASDSRLLQIRYDEFHRLFTSNPHFAKFICQNISHKFRLLSFQVTALSYATAQYRVARYLLELCETHGEPDGTGVRILIQFTHQEMANLAGTTRVTVTQVFRRLEQIDILCRDGDYFYIRSLKALRHLLDDPKASHVQNRRVFEEGQ